MDTAKLKSELDATITALKGSASIAEQMNAISCENKSLIEDIRSLLGVAETKIEHAFDILNDTNAPCRIMPSDIVAPKNENEEHATIDASMLEKFGISANKDAVDVIRQTVNENEALELGEVDESAVDSAIGSETMERFFVQIANDSVRGEIFKYRESNESKDGGLLVSFVLNIPKTATRAYAVQMMSVFAKWLNEYGYDVDGNYATAGTRSIGYNLVIKEQENGDAHEDASIIPAATRERIKEIDEIVVAAAMTILNAHVRGCGRTPSYAKLMKISPELIESMKYFVSYLVGIGLKLLAEALLSNMNVATTILSMRNNNEYSLSEEDETRFRNVHRVL